MTSEKPAASEDDREPDVRRDRGWRQCQSVSKRDTSGTSNFSRSFRATSTRRIWIRPMRRRTYSTRSSRRHAGRWIDLSVLGTKLPGPGTIYLGQDMRFLTR